MSLLKRIYILLIIFLPLTGWGQAAAEEPARVEILNAGELVLINTESQEIRKLFEDVRLKHEGTIMYCDSATQYVGTNYIEAYGNIRIVQGDSITVKGDTLNYFGDSKLAIIKGREAQLLDENRTVTSKRLEYDMQNGLASYKTPGITIDKTDTLYSNTGTYNTRTKEYTYIHDVKLISEKYTLTTDTLLFESLTKWSYFWGDTKIANKDGVLSGKRGRHNTETGESIFETRTFIENESYTLTGDSLYYDEPNQTGYAKGNVEIFARKDSTILNGDEGLYRGQEGFSKVFGKALVRTVLSSDTLYIRADTLYSLENQQDSSRTFIADRNVHIFKSDFQGLCDSLSYSTLDSIINFYKKPILWGDSNQMEADSITVWLVNNKINKMHLRGNSFVISEDTLIHQHNQVKGRTILAHFNDRSKIEKVFVDGNGESIYYAIDDVDRVIGLNRVMCGKMNIDFEEERVHRIAFLGRPDGKLIPPHEIKGPERQLEGFRWRINEKPTKAITTWQIEGASENDENKL